MPEILNKFQNIKAKTQSLGQLSNKEVETMQIQDIMQLRSLQVQERAKCALRDLITITLPTLLMVIICKATQCF